MSTSKTMRLANRMIRERQAAAVVIEPERPARRQRQTAPDRKQPTGYSPHWVDRAFWRGECNCRACVDARGQREVLVKQDGSAADKVWHGRRVPRPFVLMAVRVQWDQRLQAVTRTLVGYIAEDCYQEHRQMSPELAEIAQATEPPRIVTGARVSYGLAEEMGLTQRRSRANQNPEPRGHCRCCGEPMMPGRKVCEVCMRVIRRNDQAALVELVAWGEKRKAERLEVLKAKMAERLVVA